MKLNRIIWVVLLVLPLLGWVSWSIFQWQSRVDVSDERSSNLTNQSKISDSGKKSPKIPENGVGEDGRLAGDSDGQDRVPGWMRSKPIPAAKQSPASVPVPPAVDLSPVRQAEMESAIQRLMKMQSNSNPDPKELASIIDQIEKANGSSNLNGIKLDALRENLMLSEKLTKISKEIENLRKHSTGSEPTPEMVAKLKELQRLQNEMRFDIMTADGQNQ